MTERKRKGRKGREEGRKEGRKTGREGGREVNRLTEREREKFFKSKVQKSIYYNMLTFI